MKPVAFFFACLFSCISHAQVWAPTGATWHYGFSIPFNTTGYVHFEAVGDTMIDGQTTRKITRTTHYYNGDTQQYGSWVRDAIFSHAAEGIVWIYVPDSVSFDTLYNFNSAPGDRWQLAPLPYLGACHPDSHMDVIDTGTTLLNGIQLQWLAVDVHYNSVFGVQVFHDTIVERLGSTVFYMLPHDFCNGFVDGAEGGGLFCYQDALVDYLHPLFDDCVNGLGLEAGPVPQTLSIYPNPGNERIQFSGAPDGRPLYVRLTDPLGRIVAEGTATKSDGFDVSSLPTGLFHCTIKDNSGVRLYSSPWMKQ